MPPAPSPDEIPPEIKELLSAVIGLIKAATKWVEKQTEDKGTF